VRWGPGHLWLFLPGGANGTPGTQARDASPGAAEAARRGFFRAFSRPRGSGGSPGHHRDPWAARGPDAGEQRAGAGGADASEAGGAGGPQAVDSPLARIPPPLRGVHAHEVGMDGGKHPSRPRNSWTSRLLVGSPPPMVGLARRGQRIARNAGAGRKSRCGRKWRLEGSSGRFAVSGGRAGRSGRREGSSRGVVVRGRREPGCAGTPVRRGSPGGAGEEG
jgi:hypothetical protein